MGGEITTKGWGVPAPWKWGKNNIHLIEADSNNGFALYRTSKPNARDMREFCRLGITEMMVLSGSANNHEVKYAKDCPTLKVVYNVKQATNTPVDRAFLESFDAWVEDAQKTGKKIAFRCECGCHRTGRLAAYYQMKFQHLSLADAHQLLIEHGKWMFFYPQIIKQVVALNDYVQGRACSTEAKYCVQE